MGGRCRAWFFFVPFLLFFSVNANLSKSADSISTFQSLSASQTLVSKGGVFELGFFTPGNSQNYYIAIWHKEIPVRTPVWIANRDKPITSPTTSRLRIAGDGNLVLTQSSIQIWSSNLSLPTLSYAVVILLDTGNLVLMDPSNDSSVFWQSFDHPTDHWLPTQRLKLDKITGQNMLLISWRNLEDPSPGLFAHGLDPDGSIQLLLWRNGTEYWSSGLWDGNIFANIPAMAVHRVLNYVLVLNDRESYFTYTFADNSTTSRVMMDVTGQLKIYKWINSSQDWMWICILPRDPCSAHHLCGAFGSCTSETMPFCSCPEGFKPRFETAWNLGDWSDGCVRRSPLLCGNGSSVNGAKDGFAMLSDVQFPADAHHLRINSAEQCELACLSDCSCTAYSYSSKCLMWYDELYDLKLQSKDSSNDVQHSGVIHLRLVIPDLPDQGNRRNSRLTRIFTFLAAGFGISLVILMVMFWRYGIPRMTRVSKETAGSLMLFSYKDLQRATNNFTEKLGSGGFGTVYKGTTIIGSIPIAVKKLERIEHGEKQFRAEVGTIGMIQHANLVSLRGFCCESTSRLLVYDYMPNGSLDRHLFVQSSKVLDWATRYKIAIGVARGLAYLHDSCIECIIHCDIKPGNILLDSEFNAKIADFGLAKLVGREFSRVLTSIRGTFGYLAPEWISGSPITAKADVYSYGMMLLEIISGRRNSLMSDEDEGDIDYFPALVANRIKEDDVVSLLDCRLNGEADIDGVRRACRTALWCIQEESDRPTMAVVLQILQAELDVKLPPTTKYFNFN